jgi:hypothetical protein
VVTRPSANDTVFKAKSAVMSPSERPSGDMNTALAFSVPRIGTVSN